MDFGFIGGLSNLCTVLNTRADLAPKLPVAKAMSAICSSLMPLLATAGSFLPNPRRPTHISWMPFPVPSAITTPLSIPFAVAKTVPSTATKFYEPWFSTNRAECSSPLALTPPVKTAWLNARTKRSATAGLPTEFWADARLVHAGMVYNYCTIPATETFPMPPGPVTAPTSGISVLLAPMSLSETR